MLRWMRSGMFRRWAIYEDEYPVTPNKVVSRVMV